MKTNNINLKKWLFTSLMVASFVTGLAAKAVAAEPKKDEIEYPLKKNGAGQWEILKEWPEGKAPLEVSQTYDFVDPNTGEKTEKVRTFAFYGASASEVKEIKAAHDLFEGQIDQYESERDKYWDATKVITGKTSEMIAGFMGRGFAMEKEVSASDALPDVVKAWFSDRVLSNQGRLFMNLLRQHGKDDVNNSWGEKIISLQDKLVKIKESKGSLQEKIMGRIGVWSQMFGIRLLIVAREIKIDVVGNFQVKTDQEGKKIWGPLEDKKRSDLAKEALGMFSEYTNKQWLPLPWETERSKFGFNTMEKILERASIVRTEREVAQKALFWSLVTATVYLTIQPPIEYTMERTRDAAMFSGLAINFPIMAAYTLKNYLTRGVSVLKQIEELYHVVMNPEKYGKPMPKDWVEANKAQLAADEAADAKSCEVKLGGKGKSKK